MDNFDMPMKFHNFIRLLFLPADLVITFYFFYCYYISKDFLLAAASRYVLYTYLVTKAVQIIVNIITQAGFVTYSGYAFYGIFVYFGLRIVLASLILYGHIKPVFNRALPDVIKVDIFADITFIISFILSLVIMVIIVFYYMLRKDAFYFCEPPVNKPKPIKERNYPWKYNEEYKPGRKQRISRSAMRDIKDRRLDIVGGKEKSPEINSEADTSE